MKIRNRVISSATASLLVLTGMSASGFAQSNNKKPEFSAMDKFDCLAGFTRSIYEIVDRARNANDAASYKNGAQVLNAIADPEYEVSQGAADLANALLDKFTPPSAPQASKCKEYLKEKIKAFAVNGQHNI